jgi:hypothetical protein
MQIKHVVKGPEGDYEFSANVTQEEFDYIFGAGINWLLQEGAMAQEEAEDDDDEFEDQQINMKLN